MHDYIIRSLEPVILRAAAQCPAVLLTGPRQSGKTTLLKNLFKNHSYVSLEAADVRAFAEEDPRAFLARFAPPAIYDEVQLAPGLLPHIQEATDHERHGAGQFLLAASQHILRNRRIAKSVPRQAAILHLLPLSRREADDRGDTPMPWEDPGPGGTRLAIGGTKIASPRAMWNDFIRGGYPELVANSGRDVRLWHSSYIQTYLERDVRGLRQVVVPTQFHSFLRALAARSGQPLNMSDLARQLGAAVNTVKAWVALLEATHQVVVVRPYPANVGKRMVKAPKVYFADTGTLCHLTGLRDPDHAAHGPLAGGLMETAVLAELVRIITHRGERPQVYFWRTASGLEVDFVVDVGSALVGVDVNATPTPRPKMARPIRALQRDLGERCGRGFVVYAGTGWMPMGDGVEAVGFCGGRRRVRNERPRKQWLT